MRILITFLLLFLASWVPACAQQVGIYVRPGVSTITSPVAYQTYVIDYSLPFPQLRVWTGASYLSMTGPLSNFLAVVAPTVNDDSNSGYTIGSQWVDTLTGTTYICTDPSPSAAVWQSLVNPATVMSVSVGNLAPLFSASVATATTTPAISFTASNFAAHKFYGNPTGSTAAPTAASITAADLPATTVNTTGNLSPLFTSAISGQALSFSLSNSAAGTIFGNFNSSTSAPGFNLPGAAYTFPAVNATGGITWTALGAGSGITLDTSVPGQISIASTGGAVSSFNTTAASTMTVSGGGSTPLTITSGATADVPLKLKAFSPGQSGNMLEINSSAGSGGDILAVTPTGNIVMKTGATLDNSNGSGYFNIIQAGALTANGSLLINNYAGVTMNNYADVVGLKMRGMTSGAQTQPLQEWHRGSDNFLLGYAQNGDFGLKLYYYHMETETLNLVSGGITFGTNGTGLTLHRGATLLDSATNEATFTGTLNMAGGPLNANAGLTSTYLISSGDVISSTNFQGVHFRGYGGAPSIVIGAGAGAGATASVSGTDFNGTITLTTSVADTPSANATIATLTFAAAYGSAPTMLLMPANDAAWALAYAVVRVRKDDATTTDCTIRSGSVPLPALTAATYKWNYIITQ